jgi:hypothetical protein
VLEVLEEGKGVGPLTFFGSLTLFGPRKDLVAFFFNFPLSSVLSTRDRFGLEIVVFLSFGSCFTAVAFPARSRVTGVLLRSLLALGVSGGGKTILLSS